MSFRETMEARKALLIQSRTKLEEQYHMLQGAIAECENTLTELDKENDDGRIRRNEGGDAGRDEEVDAERV